jgi:tRNA dimethylallyltransferase
MTSFSDRMILVLVGPTGIGKTDLSLEITKKLTMEIVSADSRQIYKYLNIGTAKPSPSVLEKIPHHFIDLLYPDQSYSAGQYGEEARRVIEEIFNRGKTPLVVGGSGLYIKALLEGFFEGDIKSSQIRESLRKRLRTEGAVAREIHPHNGHRIIRALEVYENTGQPLSALQQKKITKPSFSVKKLGLNMDRPQLYQRINNRVIKMFNQGLVEEVHDILSKGYQKDLNSLNTVGYKEVIQYLDGVIDYEACVQMIQRNSRNYAKRQLTWFRPDKEILWYEIKKETDLLSLTDNIVAEFQEGK